MRGHVQKTLDRILAINYQVDPVRRWSHVALFKEFLRRMALWSVALNQTADWPFFDVAERITSNLRMDERAKKILEAYLRHNPGIGIMADVYRWSLKWSIIEKTPEVERFGLPNPYEPLLVLYERGGNVRLNEKGFWEVSQRFGLSNMELTTYDRSKPFIDLDPALLDILDMPEESM